MYARAGAAEGIELWDFCSRDECLTTEPTARAAIRISFRAFIFVLQAILASDEVRKRVELEEGKLGRINYLGLYQFYNFVQLKMLFV